MSLRVTLAVAWHGLAANKVRSGLTLLGVIIGVATVIALLSIGQGVTDSITNRISSAGTNLVYVTPGSVQGPGGVQGGGGTANLTLADAEAIAASGAVPNVTWVLPTVSRRTQVVAGDANVNTELNGVTVDYLAGMGLTLAAGRGLEARDQKSQANVAVLGSQAAQDLFGTDAAVGKYLRVTLPPPAEGVARLKVVGVLAATGESAIFGGTDDAVFAPLSTVQNELAPSRNAQGKATVSRVTVVAAEARSAEVVASIEALLRRRHRLAEGATADFSVLSQEDMLELASSVSGTLSLFLGAIALISLVVGGIGIMNIMLVSVTERTREIGIRKAVGARRRDILRQFLGEALLLGVLGGLAGVAAGIGVAWAVDASGFLSTAVAPPAVLIAFGFALAVGLVAGVYPAARAAALRPIEALRYE
jgi:putative ABC transport system permease protein